MRWQISFQPDMKPILEQLFDILSTDHGIERNFVKAIKDDVIPEGDEMLKPEHHSTVKTLLDDMLLKICNRAVGKVAM